MSEVAQRIRKSRPLRPVTAITIDSSSAAAAAMPPTIAKPRPASARRFEPSKQSPFALGSAFPWATSWQVGSEVLSDAPAMIAPAMNAMTSARRTARIRMGTAIAPIHIRSEDAAH